MKTIGYYDDSVGPGGTTRYLFELLRGLDRVRFRPVFFAPVRRPWHGELESSGVELVTGPAPEPVANPTTPRRLPLRPAPVEAPKGLAALKGAIGWHRGLRREVADLARLFQRQKVDLLHSNNAGEEAAPIAARAAGIPRVVATLHVDPSYDLFHEHEAPRHMRLKRRSMAALDLAIAVSKQTAIDWRAHLGMAPGDRPKMVAISNGIAATTVQRRRSREEAKAALGLPGDAIVLGSIGRLDYAKGYGDLLAALPELFARFPRARMIHAGGGPLADALATEAERLGIAGRVHWLGFRSDVRDLLEATDLYLQPSWCETQGLAVLEAGAMQLPVVATAVGGLPETLDGGRCGWLVPPRDPAALGATLAEVLTDPVEMTRRGELLSRRVREHFTREAMVEATMRCYEELLTGTAPI